MCGHLTFHADYYPVFDEIVLNLVLNRYFSNSIWCVSCVLLFQLNAAKPRVLQLEIIVTLCF